jgi:hypothetical protein
MAVEYRMREQGAQTKAPGKPDLFRIMPWLLIGLFIVALAAVGADLLPRLFY